MRHIGRQPRAVAERVILGETMRRRRRHRVMNEGYQRQRLHHGEIDADFFGGAKLAIHTAAALASIAAVAPRLKPSAKAPAVMPMISDCRTMNCGINPSRIQSCERAMPSWVFATTKAGSVKQPM